ncbi:hypothetical protein DUI87_07408 [Hirundo rustica rustica]|uniref:Retroviral nucleocapsid Gag protein p24 C-terminal domain-containing protein n=1 Tax=Hirundo rustica rustica TaxID=333673 RepID=A0A3M0KUZ5_HIRRU|nr:hypothetical protein DUI87_07408 [Hirundo rustica rustica]
MILPTQSFTTIKQGPDESFIKFIDRLKIALKKPIESREVRKEMLVKLVLMNANKEIKEVLRSLPLEPEPTFDQIIEVTVKHTSSENTVAQAVAKCIAEGVSGAFAIVVAQENQRCFVCGEPGHQMKDRTHIPTGIKDGRQDHQWLRAGNGQQSAGQPRAKTPNAQLFHPAATAHSAPRDGQGQFPHGPKTAASKIPSHFKEVHFIPR